LETLGVTPAGRSSQVRVAQRSEVMAGRPNAVRVGDRAILLYRIGERFYATDSMCTHADVDLADGRIVGGLIECPLHAAYFDIASGRGMGLPITRDLATYPVTIVDDDLFVDLACGLVT
jgi:3-phenylpropionate/trans-cinnamate dioxygenase ferredoxin subunit